MNAIAHISPPRLVDQAAGFRPTHVTAIGLVIERLFALQAGPELDADIFRAMGWEVQPPSPGRPVWRVRSPYTRLWMPQPPVTTTMDGAAILRLRNWDYGLGRKGIHGFAWVREEAPPHRYFEASLGTPPQCLARCWLHAWRDKLLETER